MSLLFRFTSANPGDPLGMKPARVWAAAIVFLFLAFIQSECRAQNFAGIGVALSEENGRIFVRAVGDRTPAGRSGQVKADDELIAVSQDDEAPVRVQGMNLNQVVQLIRGPAGSTVRLILRPHGDERARNKTVTLRRADLRSMSLGPLQNAVSPRLEPGKLAPEISGEDVDGKNFKLSDYRRKVVLLDFWGDW